MKEKIAVWLSQRHGIPYRFRKSFVKRLCPKILSDYSFEINFHGLKYAGNTKNEADRIFFMFGGFKKYLLSFMKDYCVAAKKNDFVFLDIGAQVGSHSLFMSKYATKIHAFEPNPRARESLNSKIYSNSIENVVVHPIALGVRDDRVPFYVPQNDNSASGSFVKNVTEGNDNIEEVEIKIGDEVLKSHHIERVDLIKINAQGLERDAIEGLKEYIDEHRPCIISYVSHTTRQKFGSKDDFESVFPKDYCFYQFSSVNREKNSYKITVFDYAKHTGSADVIAVAKEKRIYLGKKVK